MRIVSQDRKVSIDFDKVFIKIIDQKQICADTYSANRDLIVLGCFDSPERAQEVFEDIHKTYAPVYSISNNLSEEQLNVYASDIALTTYDNYVYYMPRE